MEAGDDSTVIDQEARSFLNIIFISASSIIDDL